MAQASRLQPTPIPPSEHQAHMPLSRGGVRGDLLTKAVQVCVCVCVSCVLVGAYEVKVSSVSCLFLVAYHDCVFVCV
jgi:hypothetical protein